MRIAVIGAGAIGGYVGAKLALSGEKVTFIARGASLEAIRRNGVKLVMSDGTQYVAKNAKATDDYAGVGPQDLVILATKGHQVEAVVESVPKLYGRDTSVVTMQNGIPFWYFHRHGGELAGSPVRSVDPTGIILEKIGVERVIGCVVYPASELLEPGVIRHIEGNRFPLGEPDGSVSERVTRASESFINAGLKAPVLEDIRAEIWLKLWGNLSFNPISALTRATLVDICSHPPTLALVVAMMTEAKTVAERLGITFRLDLEQRIAGARKVGKHRTSMLQDVEAGRIPEVDALVGSVIELGRLTSTPTPHIDAVYALIKLLAQGLPVAAERLAARPVSETNRAPSVLHA
jgi:2-dehydropantoate 2-reductase